MLFPDTEKVEYERPSVVEVICELRFPRILKIDSESPAIFQDKVRSGYPFFEKKSSLMGLPSELLKALPIELSIEGGESVYQFASEDRLWTVAMNGGSLSLSTRQYKRWTDFKNHLALPLSALVETYTPGFFTRIGLRYRNLLVPSKLGVKDCAWSDLVQPYILGALSVPDVRDSVDASVQQLLIRLPNQAGMVRINHGLAKDNETGQVCYSIDNDFFVEGKTEVNDALERLSFFKRIAFTLFRWCITDRLHAAMGPTRIS